MTGDFEMPIGNPLVKHSILTLYFPRGKIFASYGAFEFFPSAPSVVISLLNFAGFLSPTFHTIVKFGVLNSRKKRLRILCACFIFKALGKVTKI
jgi:hypothetical protein